MRLAPLASLALLALPALLFACGGEPIQLAPQAEKLTAEAPKSTGAQRFVVESTGGTLEFTMDAPIEKIRGRVPPSAVTGEIFINARDIASTTGIIHVDLAALDLFQSKADAAGQPFGAETRNDTQNQHARAWLEIGPDTPDDILKRNNLVEFSLRQVTDLSATDLTQLTGAERKVTFTAVGEFLLHQRSAAKSVKMEATFAWSGDAPTSVRIHTLEPLEIGLEEYDVRPREAFAKLAAKTLEALSDKVARSAAVRIELTATPAPGPT